MDDPPRQNRFDSHKTGDKLVHGPVHHLGRRADLLNPSFVHYRQAFAQPERLRLIVGRGYCRGVRFAEDPFEVIRQRLPGRRIERREGFVEKNDLGFCDEGPGEAGPLRLAAGELPRGAFCQMTDAEALQVFGHNPFDLASNHPADLEARGDVFEDGCIKQKRLLENHRNVAAVVKSAVGNRRPPEQNFPLPEFQQAGQRQQQRGFPRAVRSDQDEDLSLKYAQSRDVEDRRASPADNEILCLQQNVRIADRVHLGLSRCWIWVRIAFTKKARSIRMTDRAMAISKFPRPVSMTVAVVRTRE